MSMSAISSTQDSVSVECVQQALERYSDNPGAFLALNSGNSYFTAPGFDGVIAYRKAGRYLVQLGGAFAPDASYAELLSTTGGCRSCPARRRTTRRGGVSRKWCGRTARSEEHTSELQSRPH